MLCSITGEPIKEGAVSLKSRRMFERRLLEEYVKQNGKDPVNGEPMDEHDILYIDGSTSSAVSGKKAAQDSIPSMLAAFQNEWDALSLELFELRKQTSDLKKELSLALYRQDAAIKVAMRATQERNDAKKALQELAEKIGRAEVEDIEDVRAEPAKKKQKTTTKTAKPTTPPSVDYAAALQTAQQELFAVHKATKAKLPAGLASEVSFESDESASETSDAAAPGSVTHYALNGANLAVVYDEGTVEVSAVDRKLESIEQVKLKKNTQLVGCSWLQDTLLLATKRKVMSVEEGKTVEYIKTTVNISTVLTHPSLPITILLCNDAYLMYYEKELCFKSPKLGGAAVVSGALHVDGVLLALAHTDSAVTIHDLIQDGKGMVTLTPPENAEGGITSLLFAQNGYWLVVKYGDTLVVVYDLRKEKSAGTIEFPKSAADSRRTGVHLDPSSRLLTVNNYWSRYDKKAKEWSTPAPLTTDSKEVSATDIEVVGTTADAYIAVSIGASGDSSVISRGILGA